MSRVGPDGQIILKSAVVISLRILADLFRYSLVGVRRLGEVQRAALVRGQRDLSNVGPQIEQKRVQTGAQTDGRQDP